MHYSVGALIQRDGRYLLIERGVMPFGFAGPAGHIDDGETAEKALLREVKEEVGLKITASELLFEEEVGSNLCSRGVSIHYWSLFKCEVSGELKRNERETKSAGWYSPGEIKKLELEPVWKYWFLKAGVI